MKELRRNGLRRRRELSAEQRSLKSDRIQLRFLRSPLFFSASTIACYIALPDEVDTRLVIDRAWRAGKRVAVPVISSRRTMRFVELRRDTTLVRSRYGLWQPVRGSDICARNLDVVVTPTVVFDSNANRIGMGGGYFDRAFSHLKNKRQWLRTKLVGFAFRCQKVEEIAPNPWDIRLYTVFSD